MYNTPLIKASKDIDVNQISNLITPYGNETLANITKQNSSNNMEISFELMSRTFFDSSYTYLLDVMESEQINEFKILSVLHNMFIGIELSLKSTLINCKEIVNKRWMDEESALYTNHNPLTIIKEIQKCIKKDKKFSMTDQAWFNDRLSVIQKFIEINEERKLSFESTRYPLNKNIRYLQNIKNSSDIDLISLKRWIEVLYKCCDDLLCFNDK